MAASYYKEFKNKMIENNTEIWGFADHKTSGNTHNACRWKESLKFQKFLQKKFTLYMQTCLDTYFICLVG